MTDVRRRIEEEDRNIVYARREGKVWHVLHPNGKRAECGTNFSYGEFETRINPFALGDCCNRRGCKEMFEYVDEEAVLPKDDDWYED